MVDGIRVGTGPMESGQISQPYIPKTIILRL